MTWLVVAVGLLLLVFLHELGHFTVALRGRHPAAQRSTSASRPRS